MNISLLSWLLFLSVPQPLVPASQIFKSATKVNVLNQCEGTTAKFLIDSRLKKNTEFSTTHELAAIIGDSYPLTICTDTQCYRFGNMTFLSGHEYEMKISQCNLPGVRIESHEMSPTVNITPLFQIRFRSRRVSPTEYRYGNTRFRRLSVGMSRYWSLESISPEGVKIQFRHRLLSTGPVSYLSTHLLKSLKSGRKYFIEIEYFGDHKEFIKIQDEGNIPLKLK